MSQIEISLFSGIGLCILAIGGFILKFALAIKDSATREVVDGLSDRILRLEVEFGFWTGAMERLGLRAAKAMHSPNDHLGIDNLLDNYINHHYEMSYEQWILLKDTMKEVLSRTDVDKEKKFMAQFLQEIATHKTMLKP